MKAFPKFKRGDKVKAGWGKPGRVSNTYLDRDTKEWKVEVKFDGIDFTNTYDEKDVSFNLDDLEETTKYKKVSVGEKCPRCGNPWKKTRFGSDVWYDCIPCGKKAEDILMLQANQPDFGTYDASNEDEFYAEMKRILANYDYED